jgi:pSer/pThr/pTyr-binding forkhead associated (FHA) protein
MKAAIVEVLDRDGHARQVIPVRQWPVTIGRRVTCDVVLDDAHVADEHAEISEVDGVLTLRVGQSVNGVEWTGTRLKAGATGMLPPGEVFQVGATRLRVRRAADPVEPERPLEADLPTGRVPLALIVIAFLAWTVTAQWIRTDPDGRLIDYVPVVLGSVGVTLIWSLLWALGSKIFRQRFEFWPHARTAFSYFFLAEVVPVSLVLLSYMVGWTFFSRIANFALAAIFAALVAEHLARIVPTRRRAVAYTMAALFAAGSAIVVTRNYQVHDGPFNELYVSMLAPPVLRLTSAVTPAQFIDEARALESSLLNHIGDDEPEDEFAEFVPD